MRAKASTAEVWAERVRGWRASGETAAAYGARHGFSGQCLHTWASRLKAARRTTVQLVRVDRVAASAPPAATATTRAPDVARLRIEFGEAWRVAIEPGFDRATLAAIVDVLTPLARAAR